MMPIITPNIPNAEPKISTMRILTNSEASCASARAQPLPATPTQILQQANKNRNAHSRVQKRTCISREITTHPLPRFVKPTLMPLQKQA